MRRASTAALTTAASFTSTSAVNAGLNSVTGDNGGGTFSVLIDDRHWSNLSASSLFSSGDRASRAVGLWGHLGAAPPTGRGRIQIPTGSGPVGSGGGGGGSGRLAPSYSTRRHRMAGRIARMKNLLYARCSVQKNNTQEVTNAAQSSIASIQQVLVGCAAALWVSHVISTVRVQQRRGATYNTTQNDGIERGSL